jgi:exopolysaccharide biosynthesis polyprenyl glycosylphosphotransferase
MGSFSRSHWYPLALLGLDTALASFALWLAYFLRFEAAVIPLGGEHNPGDYLRAWPVAAILLVLSFSFMRLYDFGMKTFDLDIFQRIFKGAFLAVALFFATEFFLRTASFSRVMTPLSLITVVSLVSLGRHYLDQWLVSRKLAGLDVCHVAIVGTGRASDALAQRIRENPQYGFRLAGFVDARHPESVELDLDTTKPRLGRVEELPEILERHSVDMVIVASPHMPHEAMLTLFQQCEQRFVSCKFAPDLFELILRDMEVDIFEGIPLLSLRETRLHGWNSLLKRVFDIVATVPLLAITVPVMAIISLLIKLESKGPVFYVQERMGLDGRVFRMIKFRSMRQDAETGTGPVWSRDSDPRRTRVGRMIRSLNLDELPQLLNVLRGDMSLVGPRPERPHFIEQFKQRLPRYMARHRVRAGITGWAQVNGLRGNTSITDRLKYDLYYIENWSFWLDIRILIRTILPRRRPV